MRVRERPQYYVNVLGWILYSQSANCLISGYLHHSPDAQNFILEIPGDIIIVHDVFLADPISFVVAQQDRKHFLKSLKRSIIIREQFVRIPAKV
jgi:hypothetical protein